MKLSIKKSDLVNGVQTCIKAVPNRTTMSILECILIDATDNEIRLVSNDSDFGIQTVIEGNILKGGMVAVEAKLFAETVRKLPDVDIVIETDENFKTYINFGGESDLVILGRDGELFTDISSYNRDEKLVISQYTLKEMIKNTIFSISENETNKVLGGELFDVTPDLLKIVSLDGQRISVRNTHLNGNTLTKKVIVPGKNLNELIKILPGKTDENVSILFNNNSIIFEFENTVVVTRLIEGEYFNIKNILSMDYETKIKINKKSLYECVDRSTVLVKEGDKKPIILSIEDDYLRLNINSVIGSLKERIDIAKEGADLKIGFNPKFLIDALRVIEDDEINVYFTNAKSPCIIRDDEEKYTYVVLPVNFANVE